MIKKTKFTAQTMMRLVDEAIALARKRESETIISEIKDMLLPNRDLEFNRAIRSVITMLKKRNLQIY